MYRQLQKRQSIAPLPSAAELISEATKGERFGLFCNVHFHGNTHSACCLFVFTQASDYIKYTFMANRVIIRLIHLKVIISKVYITFCTIYEKGKYIFKMFNMQYSEYVDGGKIFV